MDTVTDAMRNVSPATCEGALTVLVISIPVILLWNVHISLRKKFALGAIMCLSVFMIVCAIVRVSAANIVGGQVDVIWVLLWLEIEACVAVVVVSVSAFRTLFASRRTHDDSFEEQRLNEKPTRRMHYENIGSIPSYPGRTLQSSTTGGERTRALMSVSASETPRIASDVLDVGRPFGRRFESDSSGNIGLPIEGLEDVSSNASDREKGMHARI